MHSPRLEAMLKVPCSPGARIHFKWGVGTEMHFGTLLTTTTHLTTVHWNGPSELHAHVTSDVLPDFVSMHQHTNSGSLPVYGMESTKKLLEYSNKLHVALGSAAASKSVDELSEEELLALVEKAVLQLLEIFLVEQVQYSGAGVTEPLVQWAANNLRGLFHHQDGSRGGNASLPQAYETLLQMAPQHACTDPAYWPTVHSLLLLGDRVRVQNLLGKTVEAGLDGMDGDRARVQAELAEQVLMQHRAMPRLLPPRSAADLREYGSSGYDNPQAFDRAWRNWRQGCGQLMQEHEKHFMMLPPDVSAGLRRFMAILHGEIQSIEACASSFMELLLGRLLFANPGARAAASFRTVLNDCVRARMPQEHVLLCICELMRLLVEGDVLEVVNFTSQSGLFGTWFMAHMVDLLRNLPLVGGQLDRPIGSLGGTLPEHLLLQFAETLMAGQGGWKLALQYLAWCPTHGAGAAEALLGRLPLSRGGDALATRALAECEAHGLTATAAGICRTMGVRAWLRGRQHCALRWLLRASDSGRCEAAVQGLINRIQVDLQQATTSAQPPTAIPELEDLDRLVSTLQPLGSPESNFQLPSSASASVQFLFCYHRLQAAMHALQSGGSADAAAEGRTAAAAVMHMVSKAIVPPALLLPLLQALVPLLEAGQVQLSFPDLKLLHRYVLGATLGAPHVRRAVLHKGVEACAGQVQLALVRAMSRAHIQGSCQEAA